MTLAIEVGIDGQFAVDAPLRGLTSYASCCRFNRVHVFRAPDPVRVSAWWSDRGAVPAHGSHSPVAVYIRWDSQEMPEWRREVTLLLWDRHALEEKLRFGP